MRISVNDEINVIEIWTTNSERGSGEFNKKAAEISDKITGQTGKKMRTVIFESGEADLEEYTAALLERNITTFAQKFD